MIVCAVLLHTAKHGQFPLVTSVILSDWYVQANEIGHRAVTWLVVVCCCSCKHAAVVYQQPHCNTWGGGTWWHQSLLYVVVEHLHG